MNNYLKTKISSKNKKQTSKIDNRTARRVRRAKIARINNPFLNLTKRSSLGFSNKIKELIINLDAAITKKQMSKDKNKRKSLKDHIRIIKIRNITMKWDN